MILHDLVHQPASVLSPVCRLIAVVLGSIVQPMNSNRGFRKNENFIPTGSPLDCLAP